MANVIMCFNRIKKIGTFFGRFFYFFSERKLPTRNLRSLVNTLTQTLLADSYEIPGYIVQGRIGGGDLVVVVVVD